MKFSPQAPPRLFTVGADQNIHLKDCGRIKLEPEEQVTFTTESGAEYDVTRKSWGFYATPSTNGRLKRFNLRAVLVKNRLQQYYVLLVETGKEPSFQEYVASERLTVLCWLDDTNELSRLERSAEDGEHGQPAGD